jgi:UDP-N-acetylenolpyruvoylglucosamine reductase
VSIPTEYNRKTAKANIPRVLLGSFSNYLVTKSSVPVMVARKKLRKQSKKTRIRLSNNLTISKGLAGAKID